MRPVALIGSLALAAAGMVAVDPAALSTNVVEARPITSPAQPTQAPAPVEKQTAIRETAQRRFRYAPGLPASIKNRGPGERAHRRWRKSRSSGRKAA